MNEYQYVINVWQGGRNQETACVLRTTSEEKFIAFIKALKEQEKITNKNSEVVVVKGCTFLSYCTPFGLKSWKPRTYYRRPLFRFEPFNANGLRENMIREKKGL